MQSNQNNGGKSFETVNITNLDRKELLAVSEKLGLSLNVDEMLMLQNYFSDMGREPTDVEIQAMAQAWSEHCCYKSSKFYLKKYLSGLKTDYTILAMEDDAGVIEFDDEHAYVVKMESHNHPSAIEPYGGAATGVGGILRDVLCMGAQPVALLDSLYFGRVDKPFTRKGSLSPRFVFNGIVAGIRDYGNRVGIPTIAGSIDFDECYEGNPLVNVGCVGIVKKNKVSRSRISKIGDILILAGGRTGRDGIHGVTFASRILQEGKEEDKRAVQLGNPIIKEPLIHAVLEANELGLIDGMKDLGGGGLSSSVGEMCYSGGVSAIIKLDKVLLKETSMMPWEIWISESQERMLMAISEESLQQMGEIFSRWDVEYSVIGKVVEGDQLTIYYENEKVLDLSLPFLTSGPQYCRNYVAEKKRGREYVIPAEPKDYNTFLKEFLGSPNNCARFNVVRQYDHTVRGNTIIKPFNGSPNSETHSDATVVKPIENSFKGLVITSGSKVEMVNSDNFLGSLNVMAEAYRNILATGGIPHSVVDSLNFGNPEEPEIMGQIIESIKGIGHFCRELNLPITAGNVSLYNQSNGKNIKPTPTIMMVGLIDDVRNAVTSSLKGNENSLFLVGKESSDLGGSEYLSYLGVPSQDSPQIDLGELERIKEAFHKTFGKGIVESAHDVSTGGLIQTLCEMSFGFSIGFDVDTSDVSDARISAKLFAEGGNRFVLEIKKGKENEFKENFKDVDTIYLGKTGGSRIRVVDNNLGIVNSEVSDLRRSWEGGLDLYI